MKLPPVCPATATPNDLTLVRPPKLNRWPAILAALLVLGSLALASTVSAQNVNVTATAGTLSASYATLKDAFDAINAGTHQGAITVGIAVSTNEAAAPAVLNSSGAGSASYTSVLIQPTTDGVSVSGATAQGRGLIELNGADNVTIDGDNPNTSGTNRNLTIRNTAANTVTFTSVIRIALATTTVNTADNNTFRNLNLIGSATGRNISTATTTTGSENTTFGIFAGPGASTSSATTAPAAVSSVSTGVGAGATASNLTITNNNFSGSMARAISLNGSAATVFSMSQISNNVIGNPTAGAADQVTAIGITVNGSTGALVKGNTIYLEGYIAASSANQAINAGVNSANTSAITIDSNKVSRVHNSNPETWPAYGVNLGGGNNHVVQNNFVFNLSNDQTGGTGAFGSTFGAYGIRIASGTGHKIYHNSVHLFGSQSGSVSTNLTSAFIMTATSQTGVDVRNNIFSNQLTGGNPSGTRHAVVSLPSGGTSSMNLLWNNNDYWQGSTGTNLLAEVGTTFGTGEYQSSNFNASSTSPASNFRAYTSTLGNASNDDSSKVINPQFTSNTDLHLASGSIVLNMGAAVGVTTDIDGEMRQMPPDLGADEANGLMPPANDILANGVIDPPNGAIRKTSDTITPQASFTNGGSASQSNVPVRFRFLNSAMMAVYDMTTTIPSLASGQTAIAIFPGTMLTAADTYTSQAIAELPGDENASNNIATAMLTVYAPLATGSYTVGAGGNYPSLTNPGGIFEAINNGGVSGNITVNIISDLTAETGQIGLNSFPGGFSITIKPLGAARVVSGTAAASNGLINLNGVDNVTIDGSLSGGTDRSLTITNNQAGTSTVIWIKSASASDGATNNTIKNCIINGATGATATTTAGILTGSGVTIGNDAEAPNSNNTIQNNWIYRVQNSLYLRGGTTAPVFDQNWMVADNEFGAETSTADKNIFRGLLIGNSQNFTITRNLIHGIQSTTTTTALMSGIQLALLLNTGTIINNNINDIKNISSSGTGAAGVSAIATSTTSNVTIANNFISDVAASGSATVTSNGFGLSFIGSGTGYNLYFNSVEMNTNQTTAQTSADLFVNSTYTTAGALNVRDNAFANTETSGTRYAVYSLAASNVFTAIDYNDYFAQNVGFIGGSTRTTLADWQTGTGQDAHSLAVDPMFFITAPPADLHLQMSSMLINAGTSVGINTDIDGQTRDAMPDIGADEIVALPTPTPTPSPSPTPTATPTPTPTPTPPTECLVCHKGSTTLSLICNSLEYRRHLDHGDPPNACGGMTENKR